MSNQPITDSIPAGVNRTVAAIMGLFQPDNRVIVRLTQVVLVYLIWLSIAAVFPANLMPTPLETLAVVYEMAVVQNIILPNVLITLRRVLIAFAIAFTLALIIGIAMGTTEMWEYYLLPYLIVSMTIPGVLWATALVLTLGLGGTTAIVIAAFAPCAYSAVQVWKGTKNIDQDLLTMASSFEISRMRVIRRVIIPNIAPELFAVGRFGLGLSFKVMLVAELFATSDGMGGLIYQSYTSFQYQEAWAWVLVITVLIALLEIGLSRLEERVFAYRKDSALEKAMV